MNRKTYMRELFSIYDSIPIDRRESFISTYLENEKNPVLAYGWNMWLGNFGADKFYLGDFLLGFLKLITFGGMGIWVMIDWFVAAGTARQKSIEYARILAQQYR